MSSKVAYFNLRGFVWALVLFQASMGVFADDQLIGAPPVSRYQPIMDKEPFGPPPPRELTQEEKDALAAAETNSVAQADIIPPGLDKIKVTLLSRFGGVPAAGFIDGNDNKSYYLLQGQTFEAFTCKEVNLKEQTVTLVHNGSSATLPLWINPATTNRADVTAFGQPGGKPVDPESYKTQWEKDRDNKKAEADRVQRDEDRRNERARITEDYRRRRDEFEKLSPEEKEKKIHEMATNGIINGGPPMPVELDEKDIKKLEAAGFDVPPPDKDVGSRRHRPFPQGIDGDSENAEVR